MTTFISPQRTEPEYFNFTYFLQAVDKLCPMLRGSTFIVVHDDHTPASCIRSIFGRYSCCYMFEKYLGHWRSARLAQLVKSLTANQEVQDSISGLVKVEL